MVGGVGRQGGREVSGGVGHQGGREVSGVRTGGGWGRTSGWQRSERCEDWWWVG